MNKKSIIPDWLAPLPPGLYTMTKLVSLLKKKQSQIFVRMKTLAVRKHRERNERNFWEAVYHWRGSVHYWDIYSEKIRNNLIKLGKATKF